MNITRQNYEEWLLLYVDNELSLAERIIVDDFLAANPDLQQELEMLQQSTLQPEEDIVFLNKASLLKSSDSNTAISENNCEQFFVLYADDELTNEQKAIVEQFVYHHPQFQANFELILQTRLTPDQSIVFPDKKLLYCKEQTRRIVAMRWYKIAAAAVLVLLIGGVSYKWLSKEDIVTPMAGREQTQPSSQQQPSGIASNDSVKKEAAEPSATPAGQNVAGVADNTQKAMVKDAVPSATTAKTKAAVKIPNNNSSSQIAIVTIPSPITRNPESRANTAVSAEGDYADNNTEKKLSTGSNPAASSSVTLTEATALKGSQQPNTAKINMNAPGKITLTNNNDMAAIAEPSYDMMDDSDAGLLPVADKKNRMRGIFRKVSRVFEKATNADAGDGRKGNIRIANFEIALK